VDIYHQLLTKYWGYTKFRPLQHDIILSVAQGNDTLALLPTGGGKSITFQIPALAKDGICLVITPLIALMKDQVDNLNKKNIKAVAVYSGMTYHEIQMTFDNCEFGGIKFLYLSPERLATEFFRLRLPSLPVNLIAVDEAHCISQWGYDFRASYLKIAEIRPFFPDVPILAVTATATSKVVEDIQDKLKFRKPNVIKKSFERKNLVYVVREVEDKFQYLLKIINQMQSSGIVYVRNRKKTREIAEFLQAAGISADYYHAGFTNQWRDFKQNQWISGNCKVIVATNAFGMGIDKPDVRFVVHLDLPDSLEAYFQEAGRGGRDEQRAYAVLLYNEADKRKLELTFKNSFPEVEVIKQVYEAVYNFYQIPIGGGKGRVCDFKIGEFAKQCKMSFVTILNSFKFLEQEGYIELTEQLYLPSKIFFKVDRNDLYKFQVANAQFDNFIKMILRMYSGVFSDYVSIDEEIIAKKANASTEVVCEYLQKLALAKIIHYVPQRKTPLLIFNEERLENKSVRISSENYRDRKERHLERINVVINYASSNNKCRSQLLLMYFGETNPPRCGQCDVCTRRNELNMSQHKFDLILEQIKNAVNHQPLLLDELLKVINEDKDKTIKVIQWLLDNHKIISQDDKRLSWHL